VPVFAKEAQLKRDYVCPHCQKKLRLKRGQRRVWHFFHLSKNDCIEKGRSLAHLAIQSYLKEIFLDAELEKPFLMVGRICDVCIESKKLIFEVQCSSISQKEVDQRTTDYQKLGYQVIWIFHQKLFKKLNAPFPMYLTDMNERQEGSFYDFFERQWFLIDLKRAYRLIENEQKTTYFYNDRLYHLVNGSLVLKKQSLLRLFLIKRLQKSLDF
jgi:competence protein CoiA